METTSTDENAIVIDNMFVDYTTSWEGKIQVKPYDIQVTINAKVITPVTDSLPVYTVSFTKIAQEQINNFLSQFGEIEYHLNINVKTKTDYEELILELQELIAQYKQREDRTDEQKEEYRERHEKTIEQYKKHMQDAPETIDDIIDPVFTNQYIISRDSEEEVFVDSDGNIETYDDQDHQTAEEIYTQTNTEAIDVKWKMNGIPMTFGATRSDSLSFNNLLYSADRDYFTAFAPKIIENISDLEGFQTTYEQAKGIAEKAISLLGIEYMTIAHSAKNSMVNDNEYDDQSLYLLFQPQYKRCQRNVLLQFNNL